MYLHNILVEPPRPDSTIIIMSVGCTGEKGISTVREAKFYDLIYDHKKIMTTPKTYSTPPAAFSLSL